jgi:hypothetical protein
MSHRSGAIKLIVTVHCERKIIFWVHFLTAYVLCIFMMADYVFNKSVNWA